MHFLSTAPNNSEWHCIKVCLIIAVNGFLRKSEITFLTFDNIKSIQIDQQQAYKVEVYREKKVGTKRSSFFYITDQQSVVVIDEYIENFPIKVSYIFGIEVFFYMIFVGWTIFPKI